MSLVTQVADGITRLIRNGHLSPGDRLPPTRTLARSLGTTRGTVVAAYETLLANGTLLAHVGRGTFVAANAHVETTAHVSRSLHTPSSNGASRGTTRRPSHATQVVSLPTVPLQSSNPAHVSAARARNGHGSAASEAAIRAFWESVVGGHVRTHTSEHEWLAREAPGTISFAYAIPPAELFPLTEYRRASDKALLVRGRELLQLGPTEGLEPLKREIASRMTVAGTPTDSDDILVTTGSQQSLDLVRRILVHPGEEVVVEEPTYPGAIQLFRSAGATVVPWSITRTGWDLDALATLLGERRVRLLYVGPNFHNPTGRTMDLATRERLVRLAAEHRVPILEDDIAGALRYEGRHLPTLRALDRRGVVIYMGSFSKMTFPGMRLGWIAAASAIREHLVEAKQSADLQTSGPTQAAMYEFIRSGALDRHLDRVRREYVRRRDALDTALKRHLPSVCAWTLPEGGLSLWVTLPDEVDADRIAARALEQGVAVSACRFFYAGRPREQAFRLAFAHNPPDVAEEGVRRLGTVVRAALARRSENHRRAQHRPRTALV
jgi:2-aminoadipate transaminase